MHGYSIFSQSDWSSPFSSFSCSPDVFSKVKLVSVPKVHTFFLCSISPCEQYFHVEISLAERESHKQGSNHDGT